MQGDGSMKSRTIRLFIAIALICSGGYAQAAITCSSAPTSAGFSTAYLSAGVVPNITQGGNITFTCTRGLSGDSTSILLRADNGLKLCLGATNQASFGVITSCISYAGYQDGGCTVLWTGNSNATSIAVTLASILTPQTITKSFWGCITVAGQAPAAGAGTYTDTVTMTLRDTSGVLLAGVSAGTFPASITYPATCTITSVADVNFGTYVAFRNTPLVSLAANLVIDCTNQLPYSMALDATSGVVVGLNYSLATSWVANSQLRGTGPGQIYTITGTMPTGQAGTCSTGTCTGSDTRTLIVTY